MNGIGQMDNETGELDESLDGLLEKVGIVLNY